MVLKSRDVCFLPIAYRDWHTKSVVEITDTTRHYTFDGMFVSFGDKCKYILARKMSTEADGRCGVYYLIDFSDISHEQSSITSDWKADLGVYYTFDTLDVAMTSLIAISLGD